MSNARLLVTDANGERAVPLVGEHFKIGRRNTNDLVVSGIDVSREHAEIVQRNGDYILRDLGSHFGTWVNGEEIQERRLSHQDRIRLGPSDHVQIVFLLEDALTDVQTSGTSTMTLAGSDFRAVSILLRGLRALGSGKVLDEVLRLVLDSCIELSGAERAAILLANEEGKLEFRLGAGQGGRVLSREDFRGSRSIPERAYATGEVVDVPDLVEGGGNKHQMTVELGIRSAIAVPLRLLPLHVVADADIGRARITGVVYLDRRGRGALLRNATREALEVLAGEAAVAIENARLYREVLERQQLQKDLEFAQRVQQDLLPERMSRFPFCETASCNVASRQIGGDFFDCFRLPNGSVGFVLGDVAGKGPPAALLAAVAQGMLGAFADQTASPAETMSRLNRAFYRRSRPGRFITLFYGVLQPEGRLVFCNAGHNYPYLLSPGVPPRQLEKGGLPIGVVEGEAYEEDAVQLAPGDTVVVYSDGITEAESRGGELFGEERLLECLARSEGVSAELRMQAVLRCVSEFVAGHEASDDLTLFVVRHLGDRPD